MLLPLKLTNYFCANGQTADLKQPIWMSHRKQKHRSITYGLHGNGLLTDAIGCTL